MDLMSRSIATNQIPRELYEDNRIRDVQTDMMDLMTLDQTGKCPNFHGHTIYSGIGFRESKISRCLRSIFEKLSRWTWMSRSSAANQILKELYEDIQDERMTRC
jgi:hypothetical protein